MLGHRPRQAQAVERRRAAADLVEDDEAAGRRRVQNRRGLLHLDHERRLAARDVVGGADAREDAIDDRRAWRSAPARTIRPARAARAARSDADTSTCRPCSGPVRITSCRSVALSSTSFGHERVGDVALDDRMPRVGRRELVAVVHVRLGVVGDRGRLGQARPARRASRRRAPCRECAAPRRPRARAAPRTARARARTIRSSAPSTLSSYSLSAGVMKRSPPAIVCLRM